MNKQEKALRAKKAKSKKIAEEKAITQTLILQNEKEDIQSISLPATIPATLEPMELLKIAVAGNFEIEKLKQLMILNQDWQKEEARKAFFFSMSVFQSDLPVIPKKGKAEFKTRTGKQVTYKYALLSDISESIKPLLAKNGLSYLFQTDDSNELIEVSTTVTHRDGHSKTVAMRSLVFGTDLMNTLQKKGNTIAYLRRYTLTGAFGITAADVDNDGASSGDDDTSNNTNDESSQTKNESGDFTYSQEEFKTLLPQWTSSIKNGKSVNDLFKYLTSKGVKLSPDQMKQINEA